MSTEEISELINFYLKGTCTPAQKKLVEDWYEHYQVTGQEFYNGDAAQLQSSAERSLSSLRKKMDQKKDGPNPLVLKFLSKRIAAIAAALIIILSAGLFLNRIKNKSIPSRNFYANDIAPGKNKAILTLADGSRIPLNDAVNGSLVNQAGISIVKTKDGQLVYTLKDLETGRQKKHHSGLVPESNTISTPRGGQYQVKLTDGTNIWLNAASSLKFPTSFESLTTREVVLTGEGYFEVAKNPEKPFIVKTDKQEVEVLGTHFDINSYAEEPAVKTTLLEGSVRINGHALLKPGEQAVNTGSEIRIDQANTELAIAWKDGKFKFENKNIRTLMRELARWYDMEVVYEGVMTNKDFSGSVSRFDHVSKILDVLESTNTVHFKVEGRRITVMP